MKTVSSIRRVKMTIIILIIFIISIFAAFYSGFYIGFYKREEKPPEIIKVDKNVITKPFRKMRIHKEPKPTKEELKANTFYD